MSIVSLNKYNDEEEKEREHLCQGSACFILLVTAWWFPFDLNGFPCPLDRFTETLFRNFQNSRAVLCYILIDIQMLEKVFCSNIAPSLSSGNHLFYKAEYMGRSCPNQVWTITFDWSALAT